MQMFNQSVFKMSKVQFVFIVVVALVAVVNGGGDAFIPPSAETIQPPVDVPLPITSVAPLPLPSIEPLPLPLPLPSIEPVPIPSVAPIVVGLPSIKPEEPHTGNGPSFNDVSSTNGSPPDCYYPWLDLLKLFNPMNQNGDCNLNCKSPKWKKQWKVGGFLFFGGRDVCCCNQ